MSLTGSERRELMAKARALRARALVGKSGLTAPVIEQIRTELNASELLKVRLPRGDAAETIAQGIAEAVPCELVGRVGFTATFFRPGNQRRSEDQSPSTDELTGNE